MFLSKGIHYVHDFNNNAIIDREAVTVLSRNGEPSVISPLPVGLTTLGSLIGAFSATAAIFALRQPDQEDFLDERLAGSEVIVHAVFGAFNDV